ncbi:MAG: cobalamin-dependent protein [Thermomicrobiales bacterium]
MTVENPEKLQQEPLFSIGVVVEELQKSHPDVSHSSLRFLEREGLLTSTRTKGGHRLFRQEDLDRIRRIKEWQTQGMSLDAIRQRLAEYDALPSPAEISREFLDSALARDTDSASQLILAADDAGLPLGSMFGDVLRPALVSLGMLWEQGDVPVAQEKEISELTRDLVAVLSRRHRHPAPHRPLILAACVEGERHEIGLRMVCGLLREAGYQVRYLGADVASRFLLDAARIHRPDVVLLSVSLEANLHGVRDALHVLKTGLAPDPAPPVLVGGEIALAEQELLASWGASVCGNSHLDDVMQALDGMHHAGNAA